MQKKFDMDMKTVETRATNMDNERAHDKVGVGQTRGGSHSIIYDVLICL
jgi:hypothetical protein